MQGFLKSFDPPPERDADKTLSCTLANRSRIISLPGDGNSIRGFSAPDLVIEDEAVFVSDSLYVAVRPILAISRGRLILMSTPHGRRGHFYEDWYNRGDAWHRESHEAGSECGTQGYMLIFPQTGQGMVVMTGSDNGTTLATALLHRAAVVFCLPRLGRLLD